MYPVVMRIESFNPKKQFGFCVSRDGEKRAFFHATCFLDSAVSGTPPIPGEMVEVTLSGGEASPTKDGPSAKARLVRRLDAPNWVSGKIRSFDSKTGWGFIEGSEGLVYFLHQADILNTETVPVIGSSVRFCLGSSKDGAGGRPRACAVFIGI